MHTRGFISSLKLPRDCSYNLRNNYFLTLSPLCPIFCHRGGLVVVVGGEGTLDTSDARLGLKSIQLGSENVKLSCFWPL